MYLFCTQEGLWLDNSDWERPCQARWLPTWSHDQIVMGSPNSESTCITFQKSCIRILAYPYGALVPGPLNFGGSRQKGLIPFTEFRTSRANMYSILPHQILPISVDVWCHFHWKSGVSTFATLQEKFTQIFETLWLGSWDWHIMYDCGPLLCSRWNFGNYLILEGSASKIWRY
jgi:hypothetical protein